MKPARREISIFNVSTIDLFASALGAFMVVSFVLLPYFPNTSIAPPAPPAPPVIPDPLQPPEPPPPEPPPPVPAGVPQEEHDALQDQLAAIQAELDAALQRGKEAEQARAAAQAALAEAQSTIQKLPPIDLVIALDTTGSMQREVASLREEIAGLSELLVNLSEEAAVGIIDFKDRCHPPTALRVQPIQRIDRGSVRQLAAFARSMSPGGSPCNETAPEDFARALRAALDMNWRLDSEQRSIVMISDNPAYEDMIAQAIADAGRFAARPGARHTVSTVYIDTSGEPSTHPWIVHTVDFMRRVARAGTGEFIPANENASLSLTILNALFGT